MSNERKREIKIADDNINVYKVFKRRMNGFKHYIPEENYESVFGVWSKIETCSEIHELRETGKFSWCGGLLCFRNFKDVEEYRIRLIKEHNHLSNIPLFTIKEMFIPLKTKYAERSGIIRSEKLCR